MSNEEMLIRFAKDAGLYASILISSNPRKTIYLYKLQEAMKNYYPAKVCEEFFGEIGGEIKKI